MTLIRTLKRVIRSPKPNQRRNESSKTKIASVAKTPGNVNVTAMANANDGQLKKTADTATDINKLNEKERSPSNNNTSKNNSSQPAICSVTLSNILPIVASKPLRG